MNLRRTISKNLLNIPGWRTDRKIIVIESDDWGSIRMPSKKVYEECLKAGYKVDRNIFSRYDSLASEEDLNFLFEVLNSYLDSNGNHPIITANALTSNPNFEKIKESGFQYYTYELITDTFKKYPKHANCWGIWENGIRSKLFFTQFHGREHLNVSRFMNDLRNKNRDAIFAFDHNMPGIFSKDNLNVGNEYVVALEHFDENDLIEKGSIVKEGLELFDKLFHFKSISFIATNYTWSERINEILADGGVKYLQGSRFQLIPKRDYKGFRKKFHYIGETNKYNQTYLIRNAYFEPTLTKGEVVDSCLKQIENAFLWKKPAIISSHRINYVGYIDSDNRDRSLNLLNQLLKQIITKWPDVEFVTTVQLGDIINNTRSGKY